MSMNLLTWLSKISKLLFPKPAVFPEFWSLILNFKPLFSSPFKCSEQTEAAAATTKKINTEKKKRVSGSRSN